jgi:Ca2+-binding EF-hand superfamily protein
MSKKINKDKLFPYKTEIENEFHSYEPDNNGLINIKQLSDFTKINNLKEKYPFIYNSIKSITTLKKEEKNELISSDEYLDFFDEQLNDINSKEGLKNIFNVLADGDNKNFEWNKLPVIAKELGDNNMANDLMKLIEQGKLFNKDISFEEFCEIINDDNDKNIKSLNESEYSEEKTINKNKKNKKLNKEESEDMGTFIFKNEDAKNSIDNNDDAKSNKRYHRRYRDTKNKNENSGDVNNTNNNKIHTKYRKKNDFI